MKKSAVFAAVAAIAGQLATPAWAAGAFAENTMLGWQRNAPPAIMAYGRVPFHATPRDRRQPRVGLMISAPTSYRAGTFVSRASAPGVVDFGFTGRNFRSPWTASLNVSTAVAWTGNPDAMPKNTVYLMENSSSWLVVGVLSVGIVAGTLALVGREK